MKNLMTTLLTNAAKRRQFRMLRDEIASLSRRDALDLGIFPEDAVKIASQAVWG